MRFGRPLCLGLGLLISGVNVVAAASDQGLDAKTIEIVALGDSLTAGYGLARAAAFSVKLEAALRKRGHNVRIVNAGVSGDTLKGGLARLDWAVSNSADAVIVELGANDALRGIDPKQSRAALDKILKRLKAKGKAVLLTGMVAPQNFGKAYADAFGGMYKELASTYKTLLYPFFLDGVALKPELNQADGIHPTAKGVDVIVSRILPDVEALIGVVRKKRANGETKG